MKKFLQELRAKREKREAELRQLAQTSEDVNEVRAARNELEGVVEEIKDIDAQIKELDENDPGAGEVIPTANETNPTPNPESRSGFNPMSSYGTRSLGNFPQGNQGPERRSEETIFDSMEYRQAFASYVKGDVTKINAFEERHSAEILELRADETITTDEIGKVIPNTIMNKFIEKLETYGQIYSRVTRLNVKGGIEFPIADIIDPEVRWIAEGTTSETQAGINLNDSVSFKYHIGEMKVAQTLLASTVSLPILENKIAEMMARGFVKSMEKVILEGTGTGQPQGIINDTRIASTNKITFNDGEFANWAAIRTKLFAEIPLSYETGAIIMTKSTWTGGIMTLRDDANRPVYNETVVDGKMTRTLDGHEVILVEPGIIKNFSTAAEGEVFMLYVDLKNYALNENMKVTMQRYYDQDKNSWINKGLTIVDGKLLDVNGVYIISKTLIVTQQATLTSQQLLAEVDVNRQKAEREAEAIKAEALAEIEVMKKEVEETIAQQLEASKQADELAKAEIKALKKEIKELKKDGDK